MTALTSNPSVQALAWALVHSLWQGAAIAVFVVLWLRAGRPTAQARYAGGVAALAALIDVAGLTAPQVRDAVAGALKERQLAEGSTVTVLLLRLN